MSSRHQGDDPSQHDEPRKDYRPRTIYVLDPPDMKLKNGDALRIKSVVEVSYPYRLIVTLERAET